MKSAAGLSIFSVALWLAIWWIGGPDAMISMVNVYLAEITTSAHLATVIFWVLAGATIWTPIMLWIVVAFGYAKPWSDQLN